MRANLRSEKSEVRTRPTFRFASSIIPIFKFATCGNWHNLDLAYEESGDINIEFWRWADLPHSFLLHTHYPHLSSSGPFCGDRGISSLSCLTLPLLLYSKTCSSPYIPVQKICQVTKKAPCHALKPPCRHPCTNQINTSSPTSASKLW